VKQVIGALGVLIVAFIVGIPVVVVVVLTSDDADAAPAEGNTVPAPTSDTAEWDPGLIFSDAVFRHSATMDTSSIQTFLDTQGCDGNGCLRSATYAWPGARVTWCEPIPAGTGSFAQMLAIITTACRINPQVALVMIAKESQGLTRNPVPAALTGFGCPDSGPGGSANCEGDQSGVWAQTFGMVQAFARLYTDPSRINYPVGQISQILWNVAESGCGAGPVTVRSTATAILYTYTPYQPNYASLSAYPGQGDTCSSYGNRNAFRLFQAWFGSTGGGKAGTGTTGDSGDGGTGGGGGAGTITTNGVQVTIPSVAPVDPAVAGRTITAPTPAVAQGLAAGFATLGMPYVWGGGGGGAGPNNGCSRGGGDYNSCGNEIGFDCSGLTAYVMANADVPAMPGNSSTQRAAGTSIPWSQGQPGDIVGFPGHVAIYLGEIDGRRWILEASWVGTPIRVAPLIRGDYDNTLYRYWSR
jgi:cell wall-associated NlpC family hydrolase